MKKNFKKVLFTAISIPLANQTIWAYNWQKERKIEKEKEIAERVDKLRQPLIEIDNIE